MSKSHFLRNRFCFVDVAALPRARALFRARGFTLALPLALAAAEPLPAQDQIGIAIGSTPEVAEVEDLDGKAVNLADYIGKKPVLVEFWATWCSLCKALEPQMHSAHDKYGDEVEFLIVAVAVNQSKRRVGRHADEHGIPGRLLWDGKGAAVRAFQVPSTSYVVVLDATGKVAYTGLGKDQDIEAAIQIALYSPAG
jgi:thiol-disulfide isomerase/thioredoxin